MFSKVFYFFIFLFWRACIMLFFHVSGIFFWWYGDGGTDDREFVENSIAPDDESAASNVVVAADVGMNRNDHTLEATNSIFLSYSGDQVGFVEQLGVELERCARHPFFDRDRNSRPIGDKFPSIIFEAIRECRVGVVILSEDYFTRTKWPMLELAAMAKRHGGDFRIMPVFFRISRADCRNPSTQMRWLRVWQRWARSDGRIDVEEWKKALTLFGPTIGLVYKEGSSEANFTKEIVEAVCRRVPPAIRWDDSDVQAKSRLCEILREKIENTRVCRSYGVRVLGLYGTGGIGKTTICKALCNEYFTEFEGRVCHLEFKEDNEQELLQEAIKKLTDTRPELLEGLNTDKCRDRLKTEMRRRPVYLAIDNVVDTVNLIDRAKTYLKAGYNPSSIVIVAARSVRQLIGLGIDESECLEMPELEVDEARSLFLDRIEDVPDVIDDEDEELLMRCVKRCRFRKGDSASLQFIPMVLKIVGTQLGHLLGFNPRQWAVELERFDTFNPIRQEDDPVFSILRWSYDALQREDQLIFMDAALFFPRFKNDWSGLVPKWNILDWLSLVHGISVKDVKFLLRGLQRKSLLENLEDGFSKVGVHDLWSEFAVKETRTGKYQHWRWLYDVAEFRSALLEARDGACWENLERVMCFGASVLDNPKGRELFYHCQKVTVLHLDAERSIQNELLDLTTLMHLKSLSLNMKDSGRIEVVGLGSLYNLCFLKVLCKEISEASIEEIGCLTELQVLELKVGQCDKFPDLGRLTSLRVLSLYGFDRAETVSGLSSELKQLQYLVIRKASSLRSCPGVGDVVGLQELDLSECGKLEELPNLKKLTNLQRLTITRCSSIKALPGFGDLVALRGLGAYDCSQLTELPDMCKLIQLQFLWCNHLEVLPGLGELTALQKLGAHFKGVEDHEPSVRNLERLHTIRIDGWESGGLPGLVNLASLHRLEIHRCYGVHVLAGVQDFTSLKVFYIDQCEFTDMLALRNLISLQELELEECYNLERLPDLSKLSQLVSITIDCCSSLQTLNGIGALPQLENLHCSASAIIELPDLSNFPRLRRTYLRKCRGLLSLNSCRPLTALTYLNVYKCRSLQTLPDLSSSTNLQTLELRNSGVRLSVRDIRNLKTTCPRLENLQVDT